MPEMRHELAVGESIVIDDYLLTVEDIRGEDVLFRIEHIPTGHLPDDSRLRSGTGWDANAGMTADDAFVSHGLIEIDTDETEPSVGSSSPRSRPR